VTYCEQALRALHQLPESRTTRQQAIDLRLDLRTALFALGEHERMRDVLREAERVAEALDDPGRLGWASVAIGHSFWLLGDQARAIAASQRALTLAEALSERGLQIMATFNLGRAYHDLGDYFRGMEFLRRSAEAIGGELLRERFGQAYLPGVFSRVWCALCLAEVGAFCDGLAMGEEAVRIAELVDHPFSQVGAQYGVGSVAFRKGDIHQAITRLEHALALLQAVHAPAWFLVIASALCPAYAQAGRLTEARELLAQAVAWGAMRLTGHESRRVAAFSEVYLLAGHLEEATAHARDTLALARTHRERGGEAWTLRLLGDIAARHQPAEVDPAVDYYRQALALAEALGMRPLQAHCHLGLGTLYAKIRQREQAHTELSTSIAMYHAMEMPFWLPEAESVLAQVEGR
jgi:tetratricopeptide (TPR) repeat protein